jgi:xylan 1,4-beta-xylosidase
MITSLAGGALAAGRGFAAMADDVERQPSGDLGNGYYKNPIIVAGDIADIGSIRVGGDYYLVHYYTCAPGRPIWHSRDLIHWQPAVHMVKERAGGGDLAVYEGRFYHYGGGRGGIAVRQAEHPLGPSRNCAVLLGTAQNSLVL